MINTRPPCDGKLFVVPRAATPVQRPPEVKKEKPYLSGHALIPLSVIFVAVVAFAGYAGLYGD